MEPRIKERVAKYRKGLAIEIQPCFDRSNQYQGPGTKVPTREKGFRMSENSKEGEAHAVKDWIINE